jgi:hypothetical protein
LAASITARNSYEINKFTAGDLPFIDSYHTGRV